MALLSVTEAENYCTALERERDGLARLEREVRESNYFETALLEVQARRAILRQLVVTEPLKRRRDDADDDGAMKRRV